MPCASSSALVGSLCPPARLPSTPRPRPGVTCDPSAPRLYSPCWDTLRPLRARVSEASPARQALLPGSGGSCTPARRPLGSSAAPQSPAARLRPAPPPRSWRPRPHPGLAPPSPPFSRGPHCAPHAAHLVPRLSGSPAPPASPARPSGLQAPAPPARSRSPSPAHARRPAPPSRSGPAGAPRTFGALRQPPRRPPQATPQPPAAPRPPHLLRAPAASGPARAGRASPPAPRDWPLAGSPAPPPLGPRAPAPHRRAAAPARLARAPPAACLRARGEPQRGRGRPLSPRPAPAPRGPLPAESGRACFLVRTCNLYPARSTVNVCSGPAARARGQPAALERPRLEASPRASGTRGLPELGGGRRREASVGARVHAREHHKGDGDLAPQHLNPCAHGRMHRGVCAWGGRACACRGAAGRARGQRGAGGCSPRAPDLEVSDGPHA